MIKYNPVYERNLHNTYFNYKRFTVNFPFGIIKLYQEKVKVMVAMAAKIYSTNYWEIPLFNGLGRDEINEVLQKFHGLIKHFPKSDYI